MVENQLSPIVVPADGKTLRALPNEPLPIGPTGLPSGAMLTLLAGWDGAGHITSVLLNLGSNQRDQ